MFDELDDPAFPGADPGARAAVAERAGAIRRRRRAAWAGGATSLVLVMAGVGYAMRPAAAPRDLAIVDQSDPPSATAEETAPATPEPEPTTPSPTTPPPTVRHPTPRRTPTPTPTPTRTNAPATTAPPVTESPTGPGDPNERDGKPGWSGPFGGCSNATAVPPRGTAPYDDLTISLELPGTTFVSGRTYEARIVFSSSAAEERRFEVSTRRAVAVDGRGRGNAVYSSDAISYTTVTVPPRGSAELNVTLELTGCGDSARDPETPIPPGRYNVAAMVEWMVGSFDSFDDWGTAAQAVTVTE